MTASPAFMLNGASTPLADAEPTESLLRWLRRQRLAGTKEGCADGDCGACTVAMVELDADGRAHWRAVNSCLLPMGTLPGREILTVESLDQDGALHPAQQAMLDCAGSQCGYCTPGFVMSLFAVHCEGSLADDCTEGNLCRCTGYGPIRKAAAQLRDAAVPVRWQESLSQPRAALRSEALGSFFNPDSLDEALALKAAHPRATFIAGGTDLGVNLSHGRGVAAAHIALDRIAALQVLEIGEGQVRIGAGVPLSRLERELHAVFPAIDQMLHWFAARQVRNRATFGGNLGSASPIGDLLPVLLALDAQIELRGPNGSRALDADAFFLDYRRTARSDDEIIVAVTIPRRGDLVQASLKLAKRQSDDISIVAATFALAFDTGKRMAHARLAYGGVAAIPRRAKAVEDFLLGRYLDAETVATASAMLRDEFTPLDDHRASAGYRRALCAGMFEKFVAELKR